MGKPKRRPIERHTFSCDRQTWRRLQKFAGKLNIPASELIRASLPSGDNIEAFYEARKFDSGLTWQEVAQVGVHSLLHTAIIEGIKEAGSDE